MVPVQIWEVLTRWPSNIESGWSSVDREGISCGGKSYADRGLVGEFIPFISLLALQYLELKAFLRFLESPGQGRGEGVV